jgi:uncharacterized protein
MAGTQPYHRAGTAAMPNNPNDSPTLDIEAIRAATLQIVSDYQRLMREGNWDAWAQLWAEDGLLEFPYAPEGKPSTYHGRAAILAYMKSAAGSFSIDSVEGHKVHTMTDPTVACVEISITGTMSGSGAPYNQRYVIIFETVDGQIKHYCEYWNPLVVMKAYGGLDEWLAAYPDGGLGTS